MTDPEPRLADLARRIVEHEAAASSDPAGSAAALEIVCGRLKNHLIDFLGAGGVAALFGRALHLAQRERPLLAGVGVRAEPGECFTYLAQSLAPSTPEDALAAVTALLTHILDLLVMLLGEELGMRPIQKLWPHEASAGETYE